MRTINKNYLKIYPLVNSKINDFLIFISMFFLLYLGRDTLTSTSFFGFYLSQFIILLIVLVVASLFLITNYKNFMTILKDIRIKILLFLTFLFLFPMVVKQDWQVMYFSILLGIYIATFLTFILDYENIAKYFTIIMIFLCAYSLATTYFFKEFVSNDFFSIPTFINAANNEFYNFGFSYVLTKDNYIRNFGIFREPGVYQFFILLALYFNLFIIKLEKKKLKLIFTIILAITMFSTFSTNGLIEMLLLFIVYFFDKKLYLNKKIILSLIIIFSFLIICLFFIINNKSTLYWTLWSQFKKLTNSNVSLLPRINSIFVNIKLFLSHIFIGNTIKTVLYAVNHNTSSTLILFAIYGIFVGIIHLISWVILIFNDNRKNIVNILLLIIFFMSFNTQNLTTNIYFWLFPIIAFINYLIFKLKGENTDENTMVY